MNRIDIKEGGFPLNTDTLEFMQSAYSKSIKALAAIGGDNYILIGCEELGQGFRDGFVVINGELLPFKGGTYRDFVRIVESSDTAFYGDEKEKDTYYSRWVEFGTQIGANPIAWASLFRIRNLQTIDKDFANQISALSASFDAKFNDHVSSSTAHPRDTRNQIAGSYQPAGTYNTVIGTDSDINTSGPTIVDRISVTNGVITSMGTRTLTPGNIGASYSNHSHDILVHKASTQFLDDVDTEINITGKGYISMRVRGTVANNKFTITGSDIKFGRQIIIFNNDDGHSIYVKSGVLDDSVNYEIHGGVAVTLVWDTSSKYNPSKTGGHWIVVSKVDQNW